MRRSLLLIGLLATHALACDGGPPSTASPSSSASAAAVVQTRATPTGAKPPPAETPDAQRDAARKLASSIVVGGQTMQTLVDLTDAYGPRLTGSDVHRQAAAWAADRFRAYGVGAHLEPFTMPHGWKRGEATGKMVAPTERPLHVVAIAWTPGTPAGGVRGDVMKLDDVSADAIAKRKDLAGKVVYYDTATRRKAGFWTTHSEYLLGKAGVAAVVVRGNRDDNLLFAYDCGAPKGETCGVPVFGLGNEDGAMVERALAKGAVTLSLASTASISGAIDAPNVVAEIKGREKPDEVVMLGAHLDSWDLANGAQDNGSGSAQVLEAARAIQALGAPPRRTMRFCLWGGEEQGLYGSRGWVKAHAKELDQVVAYLNTDYGAGRPTGWDVDGRDDVKQTIAPIAKELLTGLGATEIGTPLRCDTDHCPFWVRGVPTFNLDVDTTHYGEIHHLMTDTVDKVKDPALSSGAAVLAVTAYTIAERPDRIAPRIDREAIAKHLKGSDVLAELVADGEWTP